MFFKNQRIGKYQILDTIGTGGFGCVYLAKDVWIDKKVAIKVPHKQGENFEKLLQEPRMLANLNHPNIVSVITAEKTNDVFYIVMEFVDGHSLEHYLPQHRKLPISLGLQWFTKIGDAIQYAHGKNVIHRDIRPANVLISREGHVKLADLGTSRFLVSARFASTRIGSPPYMAPEHFQGKATLQSDIYSFGVLMYECLAGRLPMFDRDPARLARLAREGQYKPPHQVNPDIPLDLSQLICRAMHRQLGSRYPSMGPLLEDLRKINLNTTHTSQDLAYLVPSQHVGEKRAAQAARRPSRDISRLFCWNCNRPVQKRALVCPHCKVSLN